MPLPETFQFSQGSLQDYVDCARRFQLRYVLMQPWPGLITDAPLEFEQHLQRGAELHHLAHQYTEGIDIDRLSAIVAQDHTLSRWWQTFVDHPPSGLPPAERRAEVVLAAPLAGYRLLAKLDLLAIDPGRQMVIVDWKTAHRRPSRSSLAQRMQTLVYRYLAIEAGATFFGGQHPPPEAAEMVYWFAEQGGECERFPYDAAQHEAAHHRLTELVNEIIGLRAEVWPLTPDARHCRFCKYRSLCERGVKAGFLEELEDEIESPDFEVALDLEQIAEVEF
jgi:CRISPR/Cas system-associated exonuclease Cas4 (RecB family)